MAAIVAHSAWDTGSVCLSVCPSLCLSLSHYDLLIVRHCFLFSSSHTVIDDRNNEYTPLLWSKATDSVFGSGAGHDEL